MTLSEAIGKRILMLLKERNMTQYRLCQLGGISRTTVNMIITGRVQSARIDTIYQIAATLEMSLEEFFADSIFDEVTD